MLLVILFLCVFSLSVFLRLDPDLGWHLFLGSKLAQTGQIANHFIGYNFFESIKRIDHEWLFNLIVFYLNKYIGYAGITFLFIGLFFLLLLLLYKVSLRLTASKNIVLMWLFIFTMVTLNCFGIRAQFLLIFDAGLLIYVYSVVKDFRLRLLCYFLIFLIGNNLHGGLITLWPLTVLLESGIFYHNIGVKQKILRIATIIFITGLAFTINPNGIRYFLLLRDYSDGYYQNHIMEWLPIFTIPISGVIFDLLSLSFIVWILNIDQYWKKLKINELFLIIFYLYLGVRFRRYFPIFVVIALPYLILATGDLKRKIKETLILKLFLYGIIGLTLIYYLFNVSLSLPQILRNNFDAFNSTDNPVEASNFISKNHPPSGIFFNPYDWGGFLAWTHPELKIFIDGRGPEAKIDSKTTILEEYNKFFSNNPAAIQQEINKYDISYILIEKPERLDSIDTFIINHNLSKKDKDSFTPKNNLDIFLMQSSAWRKVYEDNISKVYFRKDSKWQIQQSQ